MLTTMAWLRSRAFGSARIPASLVVHDSPTQAASAATVANGTHPEAPVANDAAMNAPAPDSHRGISTGRIKAADLAAQPAQLIDAKAISECCLPSRELEEVVLASAAFTSYTATENADALTQALQRPNTASERAECLMVWSSSTSASGPNNSAATAKNAEAPSAKPNPSEEKKDKLRRDVNRGIRVGFPVSWPHGQRNNFMNEVQFDCNSARLLTKNRNRRGREQKNRRNSESVDTQRGRQTTLAIM